jgi:tripartite-type tricarboxylate transporter receptor subunit TctC
MTAASLPGRRAILRVAWLLGIIGFAACQPLAEDGAPIKTGAAAFYDGRNIRWIIPYSPGGGYDEYARLIAPFLEKYTGARVDIYNMPGAGGMRGVNELFNAPKNGLTIGTLNGSALIMNELAGIRGADYKIAEFDFLGRIVADRRVFVVSLDSGYGSIEAVWSAGDKVKVGATGLGGSTYVDAVIANEVFGWGLDIIHGFDSSSVIHQAMLRGNIAGTWGSWGSVVGAVDVGRDKIILQSGRQRLEDLADIPTTLELADRTADPERTTAILNIWQVLQDVGRPVAAPPGTNPDRYQFLIEAFESAMNDAEFLALASRSGRPIDFATAAEMRQLVIDATVMPGSIRSLFVQAIRGEL